MRLNLKLVAILIIAIYCLSPLAAVDFSHADDNSTADNDKSIAVSDDDVKDGADDNSDSHDDNKKVNDDDKEVKTKNETSKKVKVEKKDTDKLSQANELINPQLTINGPDTIKLGQKFGAKIGANKNFTGTVEVQMDNSTPQDWSVVNGTADKINFENLGVGEHTVKVSYEADDKYTASSAKHTFNVLNNTVDPNLSVSVKNIREGEDALVEVHANETLTGTAAFALKNSQSGYINIVNGYGNATVKDLTAGKYTVLVYYGGDTTFNHGNASANFTVGHSKTTPNLAISVKDTNFGKDAPVTITANETFSGTVDVTVNGTDMVVPIEVTSGEGHGALKNLATGNYTAKATFKGNDDFNPENATTTFNVGKKDANLTLKVQDINVGQKPNFEVTADSNFTGSVMAHYSADGSAWSVFYIDVVNGHGNGTVMGDFTFESKYIAYVESSPEGEFAKSVSDNTTFNVKKYSSSLTVDVDDVYGTNTAVAKVHSDANLFQVAVKLDNTYTKYVNLVNGEGNVTFDDLKDGNHNVTARYAGNSSHSSVSNSTTFSVNKYGIDLDVKADNITIGEDARIFITTNKSYTGYAAVLFGGHPVSAYITNGTCNLTYHDLGPGDYSIKVMIEETSKFKGDEKSVNFSVKKFDPNLNISVKDVKLGEPVVVEVTTNQTFSGDVKVQIENGVYNVSVTHGYGNKTIQQMSGGFHEAKAIFNETDKFAASEKTTTFEVIRNDPELNVKVDDVMIGEDVNVKVSANKILDGEIVKVQVGGGNYSVTLNALGEGNVTVKNLTAGKYEAKAIYDGNEVFSPVEKTVPFEVKKYDSNLDVKVSDIDVGSDANVVVTTNSEISGDVQVQIGTSVHNVSVVNGQGSAKVSGLIAGKYSAKATFNGTDKFAAAEKTVTFNVNKFDPKLKVSVSSVRQSEKPVVTVTTDSKFSGKVNVKVGSSSYVVDVLNGKGTKKISSLKKGKHTATATLGETATFKSATKSVSFNIKADTVKLVLKKTKIKKSAKKATLQATLKINGKAVKGKVVKFKFKGKTYKAKTNAKGIAKVTIKKSVLKKLKVGKKVTYKATYSPKTVKKTVKVLR